METITVYGDYGNEFDMTREQAAQCSHQGECIHDVEAVIPELDLSGIDPEELRIELSEYGAWDDEELSNHDENLNRWVWLCACDIMDGRYDD